jgi:hypothetical protein
MPETFNMDHQHIEQFSDPPFKKLLFLNGRIYDVKTCMILAQDRRLIHLLSGETPQFLDSKLHKLLTKPRQKDTKYKC